MNHFKTAALIAAAVALGTMMLLTEIMESIRDFTDDDWQAEL